MNAWTRLHDDPARPVTPQPIERFHPTSRDWRSLSQIVQQAEDRHVEVRASGSHWALSHAAVTDGYQIETNDPESDANGNVFSSLNETLYDVIPRCMSGAAMEFFLSQGVPPFDPAVPPNHGQIYLYHVEAGTKIFELYCRLDGGDDNQLDSLACQDGFANYKGPWAMQTLGGAGGQTIVGALSTGTHGGDVNLAPIPDAVQAVHLIGVGGRQYWIERPLAAGINLVDDDQLRRTYPGIEVVRDDDVLNSVIVAAGRMGVIYSVVLRVVRQFGLHEDRVESTWSSVRAWLTQPSNAIFGPPSGLANRRFVQVILSPNARWDDKSQHNCYVTTRDLAAVGTVPKGRAERCGTGLVGNSYALEAHGSFYNTMCESDSPLHAAVGIIISELITIRNAFVVTAAVSTFWFPVLAYYARSMAIATQATIMVFNELRSIMPRGPLGTTLAAITNWAAATDNFEILRRMNGIAFDSNQAPRTLDAISYAVMDVHDYRGDSCIPWGDSLEVFFEASDANAVVFVDRLVDRVTRLEAQRLGFGGYVAIRFMKGSDARIGMQKWARTISFEVAGMGEIKGTEPFLEETERDAVALRATVHWGQRNNLSMDQVEDMYDPRGPKGALFTWRKVLSDMTANGRLAAFSTAFTRHRGLEIVQPRAQAFNVTPDVACAGSTTRVTWYAGDNPPGTVADLVVASEGAPDPPQVIRLGALEGTRDDIPVPAGRSTFMLLVAKELNGRTLTDRASWVVTGLLDGDVVGQDPPVVCMIIDGASHWGAEISFDESTASELAVDELFARFASQPLSPVPVGTCRRDGMPDLVFSRLVPRLATSPRPMLKGRWLFFVQDAGCEGPPPSLRIEFKVACDS